jgi:hypothetical protein
VLLMIVLALNWAVGRISRIGASGSAGTGRIS